MTGCDKRGSMLRTLEPSDTPLRQVKQD